MVNSNIDNFNNPSPADIFFITQDTGGVPYDVLQENGSGMLGGYRNVLVNVLGTPDPSSAIGFVGTSGGVSEFNLSAESAPPNGLGTSATLQYSGSNTTSFQSPNSLTNAAALPNIDLTNNGINTGISLNFDVLKAGSSTAITVPLQITATGPTGSATFGALLNQSTSAFTYAAPFSTFVTTGTFSFSDITSLTITLNSSAEPGLDYDLLGVQATDLTGAGFNFTNTAPASISGYVYVDPYNTGVRVAGDPPVQGVVVDVTNSSNVVVGTTTTNANGYYSVTGLPVGTYSVSDVQPINFIPGKSTPGTPAGGTSVNSNLISTVVLTTGVAGINYNFAEIGLTPQYINKGLYLYPTTPVNLVAVYAAGTGTAGVAGTAVVTNGAVAAAQGSSSTGSSSTTAKIAVTTPTTTAIKTTVAPATTTKPGRRRPPPSRRRPQSPRSWQPSCVRRTKRDGSNPVRRRFAQFILANLGRIIRLARV